MTPSLLLVSAFARASDRAHVPSRIHYGREQEDSVTWRHVTQGSVPKNPGQTGSRALRVTHAPECQVGDVVNDGETSSVTTLAEKSSAENDEEHRGAYGRARIAIRKGFWRDLKAGKKQAAESSQKHGGGKRHRRQR
jgi:hypothetical protein